MKSSHCTRRTHYPGSAATDAAASKPLALESIEVVMMDTGSENDPLLSGARAR